MDADNELVKKQSYLRKEVLEKGFSPEDFLMFLEQQGEGKTDLENWEFEDLKKMGVVLKRAIYFITCNGKMMYPTKLEEDYITRNLISNKEKLPFDRDGMTYRQLSLFDDEQEVIWQQAING